MIWSQTNLCILVGAGAGVGVGEGEGVGEGVVGEVGEVGAEGAEEVAGMVAVGGIIVRDQLAGEEARVKDNSITQRAGTKVAVKTATVARTSKRLKRKHLLDHQTKAMEHQKVELLQNQFLTWKGRNRLVHWSWPRQEPLREKQRQQSWLAKSSLIALMVYTTKLKF